MDFRPLTPETAEKPLSKLTTIRANAEILREGSPSLPESEGDKSKHLVELFYAWFLNGALANTEHPRQYRRPTQDRKGKSSCLFCRLSST